MTFRFLGVFAALLVVAACESTPDDTAVSSGSGTGTSASTMASTGGSGSVSSQSLGSPTPGSQEDLVVNVGDRVHFDFDRYDLKPEARETLQKQAAWLRQYPTVAVTIEGHADERGTREYNLALGERRANAVKDYLVALGIASDRITTLSYGKERPVALGSNEEAWAKNRRAVTVIGRRSPVVSR